MTSCPPDDIIAPFSLDNAPVRGRIVRMGAGRARSDSASPRLSAPCRMLLGEALTLAALIGSLLKADGRLVVQAQGEGPVTLLVAEHSSGGLRGYARLAEGAAKSSRNANRMPPANCSAPAASC
jgi:molecular chaperone Hsp33